MKTLQQLIREHQGTWEKMKRNYLKNNNVAGFLLLPKLTIAQLEFYDRMISWCIKRQLR